ncbi:MAG: thiamine diphosphokinase [Clostridia bacterium]|nr:thiamine diphosphokinase [Clostridia bacterium]
MKNCYIVGAGELYGSFDPDKDDLVIAADGGYDALVRLGIRCDLLIGDMDSVSKIPDGIEIIRYKKEKDETDLHLAYLEGARRGFHTFCIYGAVGGRSDHTLAAYSLLLFIAERGDRATLYGRGDVAFVIKNNATRVSGKAGKRVSVFAIGGNAVGVDIKGLYYTLQDATLTPSFPLGVSNEFTSSEAQISVRDGALLVICEQNP